MHQYLVTFMPLGPDGRTTERTITAASWCPDDEWIDFRTEDGAVTHRVAHGCVLSVEVLPETAAAAGAGIAAEALAQMPGEPYPLDEPLPAWEHDLLAEKARANVGQTPPEAENRTAGTGFRVATAHVDIEPSFGTFREKLAGGLASALRDLADDIAGSPFAPLRPFPQQIFQRKPRTGDRVHYVSEDGACLPAQVFDIGTAEINERDPAGDGRYREALSLTAYALDTSAHHLGGVLHEPGTFTGGAREARPGEPMPLITCADMTYPPGTWHWPAGDP